MTATYRTTLIDTADGKATFGLVHVAQGAGWRLVGQTNNYREYPRSVRVRTAAAGIARKHAGWPSLALVARGGMEIIEA